MVIRVVVSNDRSVMVFGGCLNGELFLWEVYEIVIVM